LENIKEIKSEEVNNEINESEPKEKKVSDWILIVSIAIIVLIIAVIIGFKFFGQKNEVKTIDDLHSLNLQGKLKKDQGYVYNAYSFVSANGLWYTQVQRGNNLFEIALHYGPRDVEDVLIEGKLNGTLFNAEKSIYITFDPLGQNLNYVALSVGEFDQNIIKAFNKMPIAACDKNETEACAGRPIITCNNTQRPVLYLQQKPETKVIYKNNCMIVQGIGPEIVKATNRLLLKLYGIMP